MEYITFGLASCYLLILLALTLGIVIVPKKGRAKEAQGISVIVAARNEANNIEKLLQCIVNQDYPQDKFELIVVSDRSTDDTEKIVAKYESDNVRLLTISANGEKTNDENANFSNNLNFNFSGVGGKKRALAKGITAAQFELLAFTDADCLPNQKWLEEINAHFQQDIDFVAGYSPLSAKNKKMRLKNLERIAIFAVSAGSIGLNYGLTCTGRNIAYRKSVFEKAGGFSGLEDIPSGDDDLMLQRMNRYIKKMTFMFTQNSMVKSIDDKTLKEQIDQETRRASKWKYYPLPIKMITSIVFLFYLFLAALFFLVIFGKVGVSWLITILSIKIVGELVLITLFCFKIKRKRYLLYFPIAEIVYVPYFLYFALRGTLYKYRWKG